MIISPTDPEPLSQKELRRYEAQINMNAIGKAGQEKIKHSKVIVIGTGSKGTSTLQNLASSGIGKIGICDNSFIQESDLTKQFLFGNSDLGKQKAIASKQKLQDINNLIHFELHNVLISDQNVELITDDYDILVDATDNFQVHYILNTVSIKHNKPLIFGSVEGIQGMVSVFNYHGGPSFKCLYPEIPKKSNDSNIHYLSQSSLASNVGAIMANEIIKVILDFDTQLSGHLLTYFPDEYKISLNKIIKNPSNFL
jgi:sulfur-carrier protein adenylyltransferase/sulfurtransferase